MENITIDNIQQLIHSGQLQLQSTHGVLSIPVINRIYKKMSAKLMFAPIRVADHFICDGHHRYVASLLANFPIEQVISVTTGATSTTPWEAVSFTEDDWDSAGQVTIFNQQDAEYNGRELTEVVALLE